MYDDLDPSVKLKDVANNRKELILENRSRIICCVCGTNEFTESLFACTKITHSGFTNLHSKCTWSTVIPVPHLHLSVCCAWREIWCATRHAWLRVWWEGICVTLIHATLLTLATICVLRCEPWSGLSATCTSRVSTLLSHHFASTRNCGHFFKINLWASASEPAGSVPSTQSQKREVGTITLWPHACFIFDWNMTYQLGLWQKPTQFDCE